MKKLPLHIRKLHVREAPGLGSGLDPLTDLSPGINVIYGPNASGKSTTLRLIQASLSPGSGELRLRGDRVETVIGLGDSTTTVVLRDLESVSSNVTVPGLAVEQVRDCRFSLRELLDAASGTEYGKLITDAAAGGLNLVQVAKSIGMGERGRPGRNDRRSLVDLKRSLVAAEIQVGKLADEKRELTRLQAEHDRLKSDTLRLDVLRNAIRHRTKLNELEQARRQLDFFPPSMQNLGGNELQTLNTAEERILTATAELRNARGEWHLAIRRRKASGLRKPVTPGLLRNLEENKVKLERLENRRQEAEVRQAGAVAAMQAARDPLGDHVPEEFLRATDTALLNRLEHWSDRVEEHQGNVAALAELRRDVGDLSPLPPTGAATEIQLLRDWLAAARADDAVRKWSMPVLVSAIIVLFVSVATGIFIHPGGFSGLIGATALLFAWFQFRRGGSEQCRREAVERCRRSPAAWKRPAVNCLLEELEQERADELERARRITRWSSVLRTREHDLEETARKLEEEAAELSHLLRFVPTIGAKCFGIVAKALIDWQKAHRTSVEVAAELAKVTQDLAELRVSIAPGLREFRTPGADPAFNSADLAGWISELRDRDQQFQEAGRGMEAGRTGVSRSLATIRNSREEIKGVYDKVALSTTEKTALGEILGRLDEYRHARDEVNSYRPAEREARQFFEENRDLNSESLDDLEKKAESIGDPAADLPAVNQGIGDIKGRLREAMRSTAVEEKLNEFENRRTALQAEREQMLASVAGLAIAEQVHEKVASETIPAVQRRAGELLREFTRGTCELVVQNGGLRVLQSAEGTTPCELEELSDGTRAQLLIAVRLAFVEQGEQGWSLPLFFDEAFANTDDERGRRIMETLLEISRQGRQVFCFTSQAGEYQRWSELLSGKGESEARLMVLRRGFERPAVQAGLQRPHPYPVPIRDESYEEYAARIGAWLKIDPWIGSIDEIPIVYLLDNPCDLRRFLESGLRGWGPLARVGPKSCGLEDGESAFEQARRRAEFINGVCNLWQQGRGKPLTRDDLVKVGVTNTPTAARLDETWAHAEQFGRDASVLCTALEQRTISVSRLGGGTIRALRDFCEQNGQISPDEPMSDGELRLRALDLGNRLGLEDAESARLLDFFHGSQEPIAGSAAPPPFEAPCPP